MPHKHSHLQGPCTLHLSGETPKGEEKPTEASLSPPLGNQGWNTRWGAQREAEGQEHPQRLLDLGGGGVNPTHSSPFPERRNRNLETGYPSCWQKAGGGKGKFLNDFRPPSCPLTGGAPISALPVSWGGMGKVEGVG